LRAARRLSTAALFRLKIASSGRGAFAGTRCAHLNCKNKEWASRNRRRSPRRPTLDQRNQVL
jgi:hypothetical protein